MTNFFVMMTEAQSKRWGRIRSNGRSRYVLIRTLLFGALIPSLIIWWLTDWTTFPKLIIVLFVLCVPVDYVLARISWVFQEYRYENRRQSIQSGEQSPK